MDGIADRVGEAASSVNIGAAVRVASGAIAGASVAQLSDWLGVAAQSAALVYALLQIYAWIAQRVRRRDERRDLRMLREWAKRRREGRPSAPADLGEG